MRRGKTKRGPGWILDARYRHPKAMPWGKTDPNAYVRHMELAWCLRVRDLMSITAIAATLRVDRLFVCNSLDLKREALLKKVTREQRVMIELYQSINIGDTDRKRRCVDRALFMLLGFQRVVF